MKGYEEGSDLPTIVTAATIRWCICLSAVNSCGCHRLTRTLDTTSQCASTGTRLRCRRSMRLQDTDNESTIAQCDCKKTLYLQLIDHANTSAVAHNDCEAIKHPPSLNATANTDTDIP